MQHAAGVRRAGVPPGCLEWRGCCLLKQGLRREDSTLPGLVSCGLTYQGGIQEEVMTRWPGVARAPEKDLGWYIDRFLTQKLSRAAINQVCKP